ncbi:Alpha/Beta hydrolase protein [Gaertneriomyces semiglobifer]|nr:Alpha/Beta hydrolase protein [Gaertneriomyces semiglobifer]
MSASATILRTCVQKNSQAAYQYQYLISTPPAYDQDKAKKWPLILFLHGSGESGHGGQNDIEMIKRHGIAKIVTAYGLIKEGKPPVVDIQEGKKNRKKTDDEEDLSSTPVPEETAKFVAENFITVSPQLDLGKGVAGWNPAVLEKLLDEIEEGHRVDASKIYVTGISMGGFGTWNLAVHNPGRFAAIAPICGGADNARLGLIKHLPIWAFHGAQDDIVPVSHSEQAVEALKELGANVQYTQYPRLKHDSWTETYNKLDLFKWFLENKKERKPKA